MKKYCPWLIAAILCCTYLPAQILPGKISPVEDTAIKLPNSTVVEVGEITVTGNRKTKPAVILRELSFKTGEQYPLDVLLKKFEFARNQIMNTALFHSVVVAADSFVGSKINIIIMVSERWYLFPAPHFRPIDRNLNQWIVEQKASLKRVEYGAKLYYYNVTGWNDKLKLLFINGYTRQLAFSYERPYIDKKLRWGIKTTFSTGQNREINYNTINDKQAFYRDDDNFTGKFLNAGIEVSYRKAIRTKHLVGLSFFRSQVTDTIVKLNSLYLGDGRRRLSIPSVYYNMQYLNLDYIPYPTKGYAADIFFNKKGFGKDFNSWELHVKGSGFWPLFPKTFFNTSFYAGVRLPFKQPYINRRFLGYGDAYLQGYEYYVMDGVAGGVLKASLTREMLNFKVRIPPLKRGKEPSYIPFRLLARVYGNTGYAHNPQPGDNRLSNKMLYSGGIGIDVVTFYDIVLKFNWSFNQLGENGLFLHRNSIF
jgi:outer membrane protein assembly factor BamA